MNNSKLVVVLKQLPIRSLTKFKEYAHSPFFNKHKPTKKLIDHIIKNISSSKVINLQKKAVFSKVFTGLDYDEIKLNYISSKALDLLNNFLSYRAFEKNEFQQTYYALKASHSLAVKKQEDSHIRKHQLLQQHYPFENAELYYEKFMFYSVLNQIHLDKKRRIYDENLQLQNNELDHFYFAQKLKIACDMLNRNIVTQSNYNASFIEDLVKITSKGLNLKKHPIIHIYFQILKTLRDQDKKDYQILKNLIDKYGELFLPEELLLIFDYAENYCIRKINNGQTSFYHEFLNIYKQKLNRKLLFINGYLSEGDYKNIVTSGIRIKDFKWTEAFIHQNKNKLKPEVRENAFNYNLSVYYYATKQYTKALRLLMTISITDISYGVGAKTIQLQSYYELEEFEPLINLLDTFRLYVMRHKTQSDYRKKANLNMLRIVKKVAKLREKSTFISQNQYNKELVKLKSIFSETTPLSNSDWIREVIEQL
ncbi:MAG: hypothetical protein MK207_13010 [Saprospiraceae bacterium]|nr:hypothetical protein [Saprospiraceae bacterium]